MTCSIYTLGHSNKSVDHFIGLLKQYDIDVVVDVRSHPFSKYAKQFDTDSMRKFLNDAKLKYMYMGRELGGMPKDSALYDEDGHLDCDKVSASASFTGAIARLVSGVEKFNIALVCGEENPAGCHRRRLIAPALARAGKIIQHIRGDGSLQTEADLTALEAPQSDAVQLNLFG